MIELCVNLMASSLTYFVFFSSEMFLISSDYSECHSTNATLLPTLSKEYKFIWTFTSFIYVTVHS